MQLPNAGIQACRYQYRFRLIAEKISGKCSSSSQLSIAHNGLLKNTTHPGTSQQHLYSKLYMILATNVPLQSEFDTPTLHRWSQKARTNPACFPERPYPLRRRVPLPIRAMLSVRVGDQARRRSSMSLRARRPSDRPRANALHKVRRHLTLVKREHPMRSHAVRSRRRRRMVREVVRRRRRRRGSSHPRASQLRPPVVAGHIRH